MKIATYILIGLLVITLAGGAFFFLNIYKPLAVDYEKLQAGQPELTKHGRNWENTMNGKSWSPDGPGKPRNS